ncbi:hypothetical protein [Streptomyces sp. NBC_00649]|uniref:hypothetical protein n=1 Tax=Streptomyces sp. NBC_00649 TaxID=2975798 RepID=UPI00324C4608
MSTTQLVAVTGRTLGSGERRRAGRSVLRSPVPCGALADLAGVVAFLASPDSGFVTANTIDANPITLISRGSWGPDTCPTRSIAWLPVTICCAYGWVNLTQTPCPRLGPDLC